MVKLTEQHSIIYTPKKKTIAYQVNPFDGINKSKHTPPIIKITRANTTITYYKHLLGSKNQIEVSFQNIRDASHPTRVEDPVW